MMKFILREYAMSFIGKFYSWGGDDPSGFDCSGFVIELMKAVGKLPRRFDTTAHGLFRKFQEWEVDSPKFGCLVFYWNKSETRVVHVELCLNKELTIGASGGGSKTKTRLDAIRDNAFIKIRPVNYERGKVSFVNLFLDDEESKS